MPIYQPLQLFLWYNKCMETITISQTEYNELLAQKKQVQELQDQLDWLLEQLRLSRHRQFGSSREASDTDGYT